MKGIIKSQGTKKATITKPDVVYVGDSTSVKSVNGIKPDKDGNVEIETGVIPDEKLAELFSALQ